MAGATRAEWSWPPRYVKDPLEAEQRSVLAEPDDQSVGQLCGAMSHAGMPDPAALERANQLRTLLSWSSRAPLRRGQTADGEPAP